MQVKKEILQVSKSRKLPVLINASEMQELFAALDPFWIFDVSRPVTLESAKIDPQIFLEKYSQYVQGIQQGTLVDETFLRPFFSSVFTTSEDLVYPQLLSNGKYLIRPKCPVIQLKRHHFIYSDHFHLGVMGEESITWGIQFSYPQLFLDPQTKVIGKVEKNEKFPNTALFHCLTKWVRDYTCATPFLVGEKQVNQPLRLGKQCFSWINNHTGLQKRDLYVATRKDPSKFH